MVTIVTGNSIVIEVGFDPEDREQDSDDEIHIALSETGPAATRLFKADITRFLLTQDEASRLALALQKAVAEADKMPR